MGGQALIGSGTRRGVEVSQQDHRSPAGLMTEPMRTQQGVHLRKPLRAAEAKMGVDDLDIGASEVDRGPERASRLKARLCGQTRKSLSLDELRGPMSQDRVAVLLLQHPHAGMEMHMHSERLGDRMSLIDAPRPGPSHVEFLQRHDIRLKGCNHIGNAPRGEPSVRAEAAVYVVGQDSRHFAPCWQTSGGSTLLTGW